MGNSNFEEAIKYQVRNSKSRKDSARWRRWLEVYHSMDKASQERFKELCWQVVNGKPIESSSVMPWFGWIGAFEVVMRLAEWAACGNAKAIERRRELERKEEKMGSI